MGGAYSMHRDMKNRYKIVIESSVGKRPFRRPRRALEDNIKMDFI
jgi:hypothetical protein